MMVDRVDIEVGNLMTNQVDGKSILMLNYTRRSLITLYNRIFLNT